MATLKDSILAQLDGALALHEQQLHTPQVSERKVLEIQFAQSALAAVERATGPASSQSAQARKHAELVSNPQQMAFLGENSVSTLLAIVKSVRKNVDAGYLDEAATLVHAEVFSDLLEQAEYLLSEGYKDPAAVLCGGVLESHLRNLCIKNNVDTSVTKGTDVVPKKAELLNADLTKAKAYSSLEQKDVTAWLGLRNHAAHGQYTAYDDKQVSIMLQGVRGFMIRHPA